jgi:hypothetical protein
MAGTRFLKELWRSLPNAITSWRFDKFFGTNATKENKVYAVLDPYIFNPNCAVPGQPRYIKHFYDSSDVIGIHGTDLVMGLCVSRFIAYGSDAVARATKSSGMLKVVPDSQAARRWDGTFICFGSSDSNAKTKEIEALEENDFYVWGFNSNKQRCIKIDNQEFNINEPPNTDYGILLRMRNPKKEGCYLFVCAGMGEWGSSGAAYYLFSNWEDIYKKCKDKEFIKIIKVEGGSDESAEEAYSLIK